MNNTLVKFCEVERRAFEIYKDGYVPKDTVYDVLESEFPRSYHKVLLIGLEAAAEGCNFHGDTGPWMRDLQEIVGYVTFDDLRAARRYIKYKDE